MKKMSKLMALLLVLVMVLMLVPASAFAAEEVVEEPTLVVLEVEGAPVDEVLNTAVETPVEEPVVEEPAVEAPVVEAAAVETPAAETPVVEAPVVPDAVEPVIETAAEEGTIEVKAVTLGLWRDAVTFINVLVNTVGADYSYDAVTNALTLNGFVGKQVVATDMGSDFAMILKGTNVIANDTGAAVDVTGDLTMGGPGEITAIGSTSAIHVTNGDLVLNDGDYELFAIGNVGNVTAVDVTNGDLIINDGWVDATAVNTGTGINDGAYGLWADNDLIINGGDIDVITESINGPSMGIGAGDDAIVKGGYTTVRSTTETGIATALYADSWVDIRDGILDLCAFGGADPLAIYGDEGVWISPCYGDVDLTASCLYLEPYLCYSKSDNPKTGTQDMASDALMATMGLLALMGMAYLISKKEIKA